jgi:hypothetical protein
MRLFVFQEAISAAVLYRHEAWPRRMRPRILGSHVLFDRYASDVLEIAK